MRLFDVNVLVNAYREDALASRAAFGVSSLVLSGFLRVVTHRRVFRTPSSLVDATESGCEFVTTDRDFARFPGLSWTDPLAT